MKKRIVLRLFALVFVSLFALIYCSTEQTGNASDKVDSIEAVDSVKTSNEILTSEYSDTFETISDSFNEKFDTSENVESVFSDAGELDTSDEVTEDTGLTFDTLNDTLFDTLNDVNKDGINEIAETESDENVQSLGVVEGACGNLSTELTSPNPSFFVNSYSFNKPDALDYDSLYAGAKKRYDEPNAGGQSKCSELMSMQLLYECEGAVLYKIETEIVYDSPGKITDYEIIMGGKKVGVSVTRAYKGPNITTYTVDDALSLLNKKLDGVNKSSLLVSEQDKWVKQILHIWTLHADWVPIIKTAYDELSANLKADTIVLVTVEKNSNFIVNDKCDD